MRAAWLLAAILAAGSANAEPLTYRAALKLAGDTAPDLRASKAAVDAAKSAAIAAGRLPDPKLSAGLANFPISGPPAWTFGGQAMTMASIGLMQDVPSGAKRRAQRERARADIGAAEAGRVVEDRNVRIGAALAWIDLYFAERRLAALDELGKALVPLRSTAPSALESGALIPAKALEPQRLIAQLDDRRAGLQADVAAARAELVRWTGDAAPEVAGRPPPDAVDGAALRTGLDRHPSLLAYDALERQADADLDAAKAAKHPDWSWQVSYGHRDGRWGDMVSVGATVSLPLFARKRQDPLIEARAEAINRILARREATRRQLLAALRADLAKHRALDEKLQRARDTFVPLAEKQADLAKATYGSGRGALTDTLQAVVALADARIDALDREAAAVRDAARINLTYEAAEQ